MRNDHKIAFEYRRKGKSYSEIVKALGIPKSTLSDWFRDQEWSKKITSSLNMNYREESMSRIVRLNEIRGKLLTKLYEKAREEAAEEFKVLQYHPLFIAGVMIYWGEGDKASKHGFNIANTDARMIKIFLSFLRLLCGSKQYRIYANLFIYPDLDENECKKYWINNAGLVNVRFIKTTILPSRHKTKRLLHGVIKIGINSRYLKEKMNIWIQMFPEFFEKLMTEANAGIV